MGRPASSPERIFNKRTVDKSYCFRARNTSSLMYHYRSTSHVCPTDGFTLRASRTRGVRPSSVVYSRFHLPLVSTGSREWAMNFRSTCSFWWSHRWLTRKEGTENSRQYRRWPPGWRRRWPPRGLASCRDGSRCDGGHRAAVVPRCGRRIYCILVHSFAVRIRSTRRPSRCENRSVSGPAE